MVRPQLPALSVSDGDGSLFSQGDDGGVGSTGLQLPQLLQRIGLTGDLSGFVVVGEEVVDLGQQRLDGLSDVEVLGNDDVDDGHDLLLSAELEQFPELVHVDGGQDE